MILGQFTANFQHGLLVISAPESTDAHEDWDPVTENFHAGPDSIYYGVQPAASGMVSVACLEDEEDNSGLERYFTGVISLPSRRLQFYDPNQTINMIVPVSYKETRIEIYADIEEDPANLVVRLTDSSAA
ncbi:hypothetical protein AB0C29_01450 [Actinoplanes sp. NPDC048791]|uniref:hypothetical protein n=1 Tax=Actinoplanes sp. NPDC048791 TaxID=3154623 RepID=UPI0033FFF4B1